MGLGYVTRAVRVQPLGWTLRRPDSTLIDCSSFTRHYFAVATFGNAIFIMRERERALRKLADTKSAVGVMNVYSGPTLH